MKNLKTLNKNELEVLNNLVNNDMSNLLENIQNISRKINEKFYLNLSDFELDLLRK